MIKNQWYAVLDSKKLKKNKPLALRRLAMDLIMIRYSDGTVSCFVDKCSHRGAKLSAGVMKGDCIRCPFHGIEFDREGKCVLVPASGQKSPDDFSRFNLKSIPVREIGSIIFIWYGNDKPSSEPYMFDVLLDKHFSYSHLEDTWKVHYSRVIENQLDVSHLAFVHHNTIGRGGKTLCHGPKVVWIDDNTFQTSANNEVDTGQLPKDADACVIKTTNLMFHFPNIWLNTVNEKIKIFAFFVPVDEETSILAVRFYNRITGCKPVDAFIAWLGKYANKIIERQDKRVVETQQPVKSELRMTENLVAADFPIIEYRSRRDALINGK